MARKKANSSRAVLEKIIKQDEKLIQAEMKLMQRVNPSMSDQTARNRARRMLGLEKYVHNLKVLEKQAVVVFKKLPVDDRRLLKEWFSYNLSSSTLEEVIDQSLQKKFTDMTIEEIDELEKKHSCNVGS